MPDPRGPRGYSRAASLKDYALDYDPLYMRPVPAYTVHTGLPSAQEGHPMNSPMISLTLNVNREQVITELTTRRADIATAYDTKIEQGRALLDNIDGPEDERVAAYYEKLAAGLRDGTYKFSVQHQRVQTADGSQWLEQTPRRLHKQTIEQAIDEAEGWRDEALEGLDETLALLNMSTDDTVQVQGEQYQKALSAAQVDVGTLDQYL